MSQVRTFAKNAAGKLILNPRKLDVQFFQLVPDAPNNPIAVVASGNSGPIPFTVGQDGPFEGFYLSHYRLRTDTGVESFLDAFVNIYDAGAQRSLMNREVHIDTVMGKTITAGTGVVGIGPHLLAESLFLHPDRALMFNFRNGSAAAQQNFYPIFSGTRWYSYSNPSKSLAMAVERRSARSRVSTPYWYTTDTDILALAAATTQDYFLTVTGEGHFEWWKTMYSSDVDFLLTIRDERNGRSLSNGPIYCRAGIGTASFPYILPEHTVIQAQGRLRFTVQNLAAAATLTAYITLGGRRIYVG